MTNKHKNEEEVIVYLNVTEEDKKNKKETERSSSPYH